MFTSQCLLRNVHLAMFTGGGLDTTVSQTDPSNHDSLNNCVTLDVITSQTMEQR